MEQSLSGQFRGWRPGCECVRAADAAAIVSTRSKRFGRGCQPRGLKSHEGEEAAWRWWEMAGMGG